MYELKKETVKIGEEFDVTVREATWGEAVERAQLWKDLETQTMDPNTGEVTRVLHRVTVAERMEEEMRLTLVEATLLSDKGKPVFKPGMNREAFHDAISSLPAMWVNDWYAAVVRVNPNWSAPVL